MSSENQIEEGEQPPVDTIDTDQSPAAETEVAATDTSAPVVAKKVVKRKPVARKVLADTPESNAPTPSSDTAEQRERADDDFADITSTDPTDDPVESGSHVTYAASHAVDDEPLDVEPETTEDPADVEADEDELAADPSVDTERPDAVEPAPAAVAAKKPRKAPVKRAPKAAAPVA